MSPLTEIEERPVSLWRSETLFDSGETYFDGLIADIVAAEQCVDLESYIFERDSVGARVAEALIEAHQRGVRVRVLMDGVGCYDSSTYYASLMEDAGVAVKIFHPLPWQIHHYRRAPYIGSWIDKFLYFFGRINQRDHRKLCVIDRGRLWCGSFNISAVHLSRANGGCSWRDYGLCVTGPMAEEVNQSFDALWDRSSVRLGNGLFKLYWANLSHHARRRRNRLLLRHIAGSRQRIWIVSAYFAPARSVVKALQRARRRGADVRLILPQRSDVFLAPFLTSTYYADLLSARIRVYEYQPSMIHAKAVIMDSVHLIGSTNFNHRSFLHDLELDIQLQSQKSKTTLRQWFHDDLEHSVEVTAKSRRPLSDRLMGGFAKLIRYWM